MNQFKRFFLFILFPALGLIGLTVGLLGAAPAPEDIQERSERSGFVMLPSTIPVERRIQERILGLLIESGSVYHTYSITSVDRSDDYIYVSIAALPDGSERMSLESAVWLGVVQLLDTPELPGIINDLAIDTAPAPEPGRGGAGHILPFRDGTTATYGTLGVHDCGFQLTGWKAVDLFPSENMVYASLGGAVSYVCRDENQVALRIGETLYTHIVDAGQTIGQNYGQGQIVGPMVPGTYNSACGYASQNPGAYHVHYCFIPSNGTLSADGYSLSMTTGNWTKGAETVAPLGTLTADWADAGVTITPGPAAGSNFWDTTTSGFVAVLQKFLPFLPDHNAMNLASTVISVASIPVELAYRMFTLFDMDIVMRVVAVILGLEAVRIVIAGVLFIKNIKQLIPLIG